MNEKLLTKSQSQTAQEAQLLALYRSLPASKKKAALRCFLSLCHASAPPTKKTR